MEKRGSDRIVRARVDLAVGELNRRAEAEFLRA